MSVLSSKRNQIANLDLLQFTQGLAWDKQLAAYEIAVQKAWAKALNRIGVLTAKELEQFHQAMMMATNDMAAGTFPWQVENEDVHMNLEAYVTDKFGSLGKKVHLGRSRNDLIATTLRLYAADQCQTIVGQVHQLTETLLDQAEQQIDLIMPGMTHLQNGQPVRVGHVLGAYAAMLVRDSKRFAAIYDECLWALPLGSAAFAGTSLPMDLEALARDLGFDRSTLNSYDAVSDRDFLVSLLQGFNLLNAHLARLMEDIIYWASAPVGLIQLPADWSTGSSIMPNKRNPDVAELLRAKCSRQTMRLAEATSIYKAIPTSYGTDLHEMKKTCIDAICEQREMLAAAVPFVGGLKFSAERARQLCERGHILATEIADLLTAKGMAFRDAYGLVAAWTEQASQQNCQIHQLAEYPDLPKGVTKPDIQAISFEQAVERRTAPGGTAKAAVAATLTQLRNLCRQQVATWEERQPCKA